MELLVFELLQRKANSRNQPPASLVSNTARDEESYEIFPPIRIQPNKECPEILNMYDLTCSKVTRFQCGVDHNMHSRQYYHRSYVGCSHGWWFVLRDFDNNFFGFALQMYNPISGTVITLPPFIESISMVKNYRVTLSRDPSTCLTSPFEVLIAPPTSNGYVVAHWKSGDKFWTYSNESNKDDECYCRFDDCIFYEERLLGISTHIPRDGVDVISINIDNSQAPRGGDGFRGINIKKIASTPRLEDLYCAEA
ncbi:hypothetical protein FNV43_RR26054 [Rhamnella rubrinervis]|uniref:KIB1-4 beta-propeller domain-containing protein n=1 Tax=Rhamnella rubrinervis TaxID=2594499 RepID=A0A8K0GNX4_9ROSA|nr:hypothetical protein FNV43_RR26054 [Rhamnella rubrinervis]